MIGKFLVLFIGLGSIQGAALAAPGEPVESALEVAVKELARLADSGGRFFSLEDARVLKRATLQEPFFYFATSVNVDTTFFAYERADAPEILQYATRRIVCFPIDLDGKVVGTVNVANRKDGCEIVNLFGPGSDIVVDQLAAIGNRIDPQSGRRVSVLATNLAGNFFMIEDGKHVYQMGPADLQTLNRYHLKGPVGVPTTFATPEFFASEIKAEITRARKLQGERPGQE